MRVVLRGLCAGGGFWFSGGFSGGYVRVADFDKISKIRHPHIAPLT